LGFLFYSTVVQAVSYDHFEACKSESSLSSREKRADFIVTGTVFSLLPNSQSAVPTSPSTTWKGQVAVKRVIKGDLSLIHSMSLILVENFGDMDICQAFVEQRDTKIFLLTKNQISGNFRLNSSVIRMTLKNLDKISALIKGNQVI
jgi:hypothetical protein